MGSDDTSMDGRKSRQEPESLIVHLFRASTACALQEGALEIDRGTGPGRRRGVLHTM